MWLRFLGSLYRQLNPQRIFKLVGFLEQFPDVILFLCSLRPCFSHPVCPFYFIPLQSFITYYFNLGFHFIIIPATKSLKVDLKIRSFSSIQPEVHSFVVLDCRVYSLHMLFSLYCWDFLRLYTFRSELSIISFSQNGIYSHCLLRQRQTFSPSHPY